MIDYQIVKWDQYYPECLDLWKEHYEEFWKSHRGLMEMSPDIEAYRAAESLDALQILVARDGPKMVGYCLVVIRPHMHYCGTICGFEDAYYLSQPYRRGLTGVRLLSKSIQALKERGVKKVFFMTKEFINVARVLEYLGMHKTDSVYSMWLED